MATTAILTARINGGEPVRCALTVEREVINVTSRDATKPDPTWEYGDAAGHRHAWTDKNELPTLNARSVNMPCDGSCGGVCGGEGYTVTIYECRICNEQVEPGRLPENGPKSIPGLQSWTVVVYADVPRGEVSVWIESEGDVWFGVATRVGSTFDSLTGATTTLAGVSELGHRKRIAVSAP